MEEREVLSAAVEAKQRKRRLARYSEAVRKREQKVESFNGKEKYSQEKAER